MSLPSPIEKERAKRLASEMSKMKEFENLELVIHRSEKWLKQHEKRGFFLSDLLPLQTFKLPKELEYLEEKHTPLLRAIIKLHWEDFIVALMKDLEKRPLDIK